MKTVLIAVIVALLSLAVQVDRRFAAMHDAQLAQAGAIVEVRREIQRVEGLTHPQTVQRRTIDYILRQGEFEGIK